MYVYVAILIAGLFAGGFTSWRVQDWRFAAKEKQRLEAQAEKERNDRRVVDGAAVGHEKDKAQLRTQFVTITKEVEHVVEKPFYRDACLDDDGMRELRAAIGAAEPASVASGTVRGSRPTR